MSFNFFLPCLGLLEPWLKVVGTSEYRGFTCYKKTTLRISALTKSFWLTLGWPTGPHVAIPVPVECFVPLTLILCWCYSMDTTVDSMARVLFEAPRKVPVTQVKELFGRALILVLIMLLFGFVSLSWSITLMDRISALTCQVHHSTPMLKMHKKVITHISIEKLRGSEGKMTISTIMSFAKCFKLVFCRFS